MSVELDQGAAIRAASSNAVNWQEGVQKMSCHKCDAAFLHLPPSTSMAFRFVVFNGRWPRPSRMSLPHISVSPTQFLHSLLQCTRQRLIHHQTLFSQRLKTLEHLSLDLFLSPNALIELREVFLAQLESTRLMSRATRKERQVQRLLLQHNLHLGLPLLLKVLDFLLILIRDVLKLLPGVGAAFLLLGVKLQKSEISPTHYVLHSIFPCKISVCRC